MLLLRRCSCSYSCAGIPGEQRLTRLLDKPLFHMHHRNGTLPMMGLWSKIKAVSGNTTAPGMGLSVPDKHRLVAEVDFVIHCAASISFFEPVKTLLEQNYVVRLTRKPASCALCCWIAFPQQSMLFTVVASVSTLSGETAAATSQQEAAMECAGHPQHSAVGAAAAAPARLCVRLNRLC